MFSLDHEAQRPGRGEDRTQIQTSERQRESFNQGKGGVGIARQHGLRVEGGSSLAPFPCCSVLVDTMFMLMHDYDGDGVLLNKLWIDIVCV